MTRPIALLVSLLGVGLTSGCVVDGPPRAAYVTYDQPYYYGPAPAYYYGPGYYGGPSVSGTVIIGGRRH